MPNALKREASESLLPTKRMKYPRIANPDDNLPNSSAYLDVADTTPGLAARWCKLGLEGIKLVHDTLILPWNQPARSSQQLRRTLSHPASPPNRQGRTPLSTLPPPHRKPNEPRPYRHRMEPDPSTSLSTLPSTQFSTQVPSDTCPLPQSTSIPDLSTTLSRFRTANELLAKSVEQSRRAEQMTSTLSQLPRQDHIFARKYKAKVQEDRKQDREDLIKRLYVLKRAGGYESNYEDFKSWIDYEARLKRPGDRILSPSASLTDLRLKEEKPISQHRHSFPDYADRSFIESAIQKLERSMESPPPNYLSAYERLRQEAQRRDEEIERRVRPPVPKSLPAEVEKQVAALLGKTGVIAKIAREQVSDGDILRLTPHQWLNDELINFYGAMIIARSESSKENPGLNGKKTPLNVHYFNTFFWSKLQNEGYERARLAKWTKKIDIFSKDLVLIPINHNNAHWTAAAINFRRKRIESYDSMNIDRSLVLKLLRHYLDLEHQNKKKKPFDFTGWEDYMPEDIPQQENGYDCGVFTCQFLEALSRGEETFTFSQRDMSYFRKRMIWEVGHARFLDGP